MNNTSYTRDIRRFTLYFLPAFGILIAIYYWRMLDNFFYSDDFKWLEQIRDLDKKPFAIFNPVIHPPANQLTPLGPNYFSPLVHIIFFINYKVFGLNPLGYHLFDLVLHMINSCLVFYFVYLLAGNYALAMLVGLFFSLSFAITEAVIWSAARPDTLMFTFYALSLINFLSFLKNGRYSRYVFSITLFILSLSAKGTALSLPFTLLLVESHYRKSTFSLNHFSKYIPFVFIILMYLALLLLHSPMSSRMDLYRVMDNAIKVPMTLLIPEGLLPVNSWLALLSALLFYTFVMVLIKCDNSGIGRLGILLTLVGVFPLFIMN